VHLIVDIDFIFGFDVGHSGVSLGDPSFAYPIDELLYSGKGSVGVDASLRRKLLKLDGLVSGIL
jgi:hypothetical protein